jgi:hypothetical protein
MLSTTAQRLIALDPSFLQRHGRQKIQAALVAIFKSTRYELLLKQDAVMLLGQDVSYHLVDPHLPEFLSEYSGEVTVSNAPTYKKSTAQFDLCFEDCWTGYFLAQRFRARDNEDSRDLLFIHLDDHEDMMPTLLEVYNGALKDPSTDAAFDPTAADDWTSAIGTGAITIGSFITPLYHSGTRIHVRHINNSARCSDLEYVSPVGCRYAPIPGKEFAALERLAFATPKCNGTYRVGPDAGDVLRDTPKTWTVVHFDLDYFMNDFNGARREALLLTTELCLEVTRKMDRLFKVLRASETAVDRWMIATSPGFCSARHWPWLLDELSKRIEQFPAVSDWRAE